MHLIFYKKVGETPLQALDRLRVEKPELASETLTYAGRLDPLAEGEMVVLVGEECKNKEKYTGLDKIYTVDVLCGVSTDTGDVLGLITDMSNKKINTNDIDSVVKSFIGTRSQPYPNYSSKPYEGKPLFAHARLGRNIDNASRPHKDITIYRIHTNKLYTLSLKELQKNIQEKINSVSGDFRQKEILSRWETYFTTQAQEMYQVIQVEVACSSGTYMRVLAEEIGKKLGVCALALHIRRDKVIL